MLSRFPVAVLTVLSALGGLLLTSANKWGTGDVAPCRDTFIDVIAACVLPQSPVWALLLGGLLPAAAVVVLGAIWLRRPNG